MIHERERLPFGFEARDDALRVHAELDHFERHSPAHRFFLLGHVNDAAAAFAQLLEQLVAANPVAGLFSDERGRVNQWCAFQEIGIAFVSFSLQQRKDLILEVRITATRFGEKALPLGPGGFRLRLAE